MKRMLLLLLLAVMLCGCGTSMEEESVVVPSTAETFPALTEPRGIYIPFTQLEELSAGGLRPYQPDLEGCYDIRVMGSDLLLLSGTDRTTLTRLSGDNLFTVAQTSLNCRIPGGDPSFRISTRGITYFDENSREVVFLDNDLVEVSRLAAPEEMTGRPILSADRMHLYYITADAVREHDLETGLDRLIRQVSYPGQSLEDLLCEDGILRISLRDEQGKTVSQFLSAETGELIREYAGALELIADEENYFCRRSDGLLPILQFRLGTQPDTALNIHDKGADTFFLPDSQRLISAKCGDGGLALRCFDLRTGRCAWEIDLQDRIVIHSICESRAGEYVFLLGEDILLGQTVILRWEIEATPGQDKTVYTGPIYTRENPDLEGLERCRELAAVLEEKYGINILLGEAAVRNQPWDYSLEEEYQVSLIMEQLQTLETCLGAFPEDFFVQLGEELQLLLVRSIRANAESGSVANAAGLQFWNGETACVALCPGEGMTAAFFHELFHIMDGKILSDCRTYYYWHNLNPQGFAYFEDYTSYLECDLGEYLTDENRVFIDAYSASFPREDRARIMEYACTPGNAHYFQSETMQRKLETLCQGIRDTFRFDAAPGSLLWEQYLNEQS